MKLNLEPDPNGQSGGGNSDWKSSLPDDLKNSSVLANVADIPTLVKNYVNAESLIGKKRLVVPDAKADDKAWDDVYSQLGRPATPDKYGVPEFKFEEGLEVKPELVDKAKLHFHKLGLNEKQAKGILEYYFGIENERFKDGKVTTSSARTEAEEAMKKQFGAKYDQIVTAAKSVVVKADEDGDLVNFLNESKLGNDPRLIKAFAKISSWMKEDSSGSMNGGNQNMSPKAKAQQELANLKADTEFMNTMFSGVGAPQKAATAKWNELHRLAAMPD